MFQRKIISRSQKETQEIARKLARLLGQNAIIALIGDLGSGKTTFVQALAKSLGVKQTVVSPSFVLLKEYNLPAKAKKNHSRKLIHFDLYRLSSQASIEELGLADYFGEKNTLVLIEWADRLVKNLPAERLEITFVVQKDQSRLLLLKAFGLKYQPILAELK